MDEFDRPVATGYDAIPGKFAKVRRKSGDDTIRYQFRVGPRAAAS